MSPKIDNLFKKRNNLKKIIHKENKINKKSNEIDKGGKTNSNKISDPGKFMIFLILKLGNEDEISDKHFEKLKDSFELIELSFEEYFGKNLVEILENEIKINYKLNSIVLSSNFRKLRRFIQLIFHICKNSENLKNKFSDFQDFLEPLFNKVKSCLLFRCDEFSGLVPKIINEFF